MRRSRWPASQRASTLRDVQHRSRLASGRARLAEQLRGAPTQQGLVNFRTHFAEELHHQKHRRNHANLLAPLPPEQHSGAIAWKTHYLGAREKWPGISEGLASGRTRLVAELCYRPHRQCHLDPHRAHQHEREAKHSHPPRYPHHDQRPRARCWTSRLCPAASLQRVC